MASNILPDINAPVWEAASPATIWLREIETVHETLSRLRRQATSDRVVYFYVTDPSDRLVGVVPARRLLFSDPATLVGEIMVHPVFSVTQSEPFGCALALLTEQRLLALPVVDEAGRLTGIVDVSAVTQRLFEMERREAADELFQMVGLHALS